jgi:hypothetical protein
MKRKSVTFVTAVSLGFARINTPKMWSATPNVSANDVRPISLYATTRPDGSGRVGRRCRDQSLADACRSRKLDRSPQLPDGRFPIQHAQTERY